MIDFLKKNKKYVHSVLFLSTFGKSLCAVSENEEETKKDHKFSKNFKDTSYVSGNVLFGPSISTKDAINKNLHNLIYIKPNITLLGNALFDFNNGDTDFIYKKINSNIKVVLLNCNFIGIFFKSPVNRLQNIIYVDDLKISLETVEKQLNDDLYLKDIAEINYLSSEYVRNNDAKVLELKDTVELKVNLKGQEFKFDPSLSFLFSTDNSLQVIEILKESKKSYISRFFNYSNNSNLFVDFILPAIAMKCNVEHDLLKGGIKFLIDPFNLLLKYKKSASILKWDLLLDFAWKKDLSIVKNLKGSIGIGFDSELSYFFNDIVPYSKDFIEVDGLYNDNYLLFRPQLFNINASCDIDFTNLVNKVDQLWFVSECSTSVDLKFEFIFGLAADNFAKEVVNLEDKGAGIYFNFTCEGLKNKINGGNIENEKLKFFLDNLSITFLKFSLGCFNEGLKVDFKDIKKTKFDGVAFDGRFTFAKAEFDWAKYGLSFNASLGGDSFGVHADKKHFQWKDILSIGAKWDVAKFCENRNN